MTKKILCKFACEISECLGSEKNRCCRLDLHPGTCRCERHQRRYEMNRASRRTAQKAAKQFVPEFGSENAAPVQPRTYFLNEKHEEHIEKEEPALGCYCSCDCGEMCELDYCHPGEHVCQWCVRNPVGEVKLDMCRGICQKHSKSCNYGQGVEHSVCRCQACNEDEDRKLLEAIESVQTLESRGNPTGPARVTATPVQDEKDKIIAQLQDEVAHLQRERQLEYDGRRRMQEDLEARLEAEVPSRQDLEKEFNEVMNRDAIFADWIMSEVKRSGSDPVPLPSFEESYRVDFGVPKMHIMTQRTQLRQVGLESEGVRVELDNFLADEKMVKRLAEQLKKNRPVIFEVRLVEDE